MFLENIKESINNEIFKIISECCEENTLECYVIGGYVRDLLIGKKSAKDIDILVVGNGIKIAENVAKKLKLKSKVTVFKNFGTAMFKYKNFEIEFVGTRKESYNKNSRNPQVSPGSLK
ncbi:tRNA nucleotidyltransferase, partial [Flavobacteriaceae bacterium]|nr:tRNA nucleotidyltransferase [Flavobacteriaceae bacterium]